MVQYRSRLAGTGSYLPERRLSNSDLERLVDTSDRWIHERTGIRWRRLADEGVCTSDLGAEAARRALDAANLSASDLDLIIVATVSPDQPMPNTACVLQRKLGARGCMAVDVSAACSGFIYAYSIADQFIRSGTYRHVLVVGAEVMHRLVDYQDRETCILFGDGAGAAVLSRAADDEDARVMSVHLHADGEISDLFTLAAGGSAMPFSPRVLEERTHFMRMKGREIFKHAVRTMAQSCDEALRANDLTADDVDWIIPHQANLRIIEAVAKHAGVPMAKVVVEIEDTGNTSAATIPIALDRAVRDGRVRRGQNLLLTAFGAGITSGAMLMRY